MIFSNRYEPRNTPLLVSRWHYSTKKRKDWAFVDVQLCCCYIVGGCRDFVFVIFYSYFVNVDESTRIVVLQNNVMFLVSCWNKPIFIVNYTFRQQKTLTIRRQNSTLINSFAWNAQATVFLWLQDQILCILSSRRFNIQCSLFRTMIICST